MRDGRASTTAQRVAAQRLTFDRVPAQQGDPDADDRLARDVAGDVVVGPGAPLGRYLAARTAFFDGVVVRSLDAGIAQVVVAAAGYDGRSLRYARPGVRWFEVDHPDTQRDKLERLHRLGIDCPDTTFVPADFTSDDVAGALAAAGQDPAVPALFLCEGVAVYLEDDVLRSLLAALRSRAGEGSRLAVSLSVSGAVPGVAVRRRRFESAVAALGEPARSSLTVDDVGPLLAATGWSRVDLGASDERARRAALVGLVLLRPT